MQLKKEEAWKKSDRNSITIYKTEGVTMVVTALHEGAVIENSSVEGWMSLEVLEGVVDFAVEGKTFELHHRQVMALHPEVEHTIRAIEESTILLINKN